MLLVPLPSLLPLLQKHQSHCQLEAHLHYSQLVSHAPEGEWARMAPFRILSVDIECQGRKVGGGTARHGMAQGLLLCVSLAGLQSLAGDTSPTSPLRLPHPTLPLLLLLAAGPLPRA